MESFGQSSFLLFADSKRGGTLCLHRYFDLFLVFPWHKKRGHPYHDLYDVCVCVCLCVFVFEIVTELCISGGHTVFLCSNLHCMVLASSKMHGMVLLISC
jgi:hypothetical protein